MYVHVHGANCPVFDGLVVLGRYTESKVLWIKKYNLNIFKKPHKNPKLKIKTLSLNYNKFFYKTKEKSYETKFKH